MAFWSQAQPLFIPNLGQWPEPFLAKTPLSYGAVYWESTGYRMMLLNERVMPEHGHSDEADHQANLHPDGPDAFGLVCTYVGAQAQSPFEGMDATASPRHYLLGNDPSKWATNVPEYQGFNRKNLYPFIDLTWAEKDGKLYNAWYVRPGGDLSDIRLEYKGVDPRLDTEGQLVLETPLGTITETAPYAYILETGKPVRCVFTIENGRVGFKAGNYAKGKTLVIDPTLVFASFSGSLADNWGYTATYDTLGNLYGGGVVFDAGYPTTPGAFDITYNDPAQSLWTRMDIGVTKFNSNGSNRLYSTYIGGNQPDQPHSMIVDNTGDLIIFGTTGSNNFPVPANGFVSQFQGGPAYAYRYNPDTLFNFSNGVDVFILKVNSSGTAVTGGTFFGSSTTNEGLNISLAKNYGDRGRGEVVLDASDNIYIATTGQTGSDPSQAIVASFTSNLQNLRWATYVGGSGKEAGLGVKVAANGDVYLTGGTTSNDMPNTTGAKFPTYYGGTDGFIAKLDPSGSIQRVTYLGTGNMDMSFLIDIDKYGAIYAYGQTLGLWPTTTGVWSTTSGGQFIVKLSADLSQLIFSTKFGTANNFVNLVPTAFNVDDCLNILLSGWGGGTNWQNLGGNTYNLPVTVDAIQSTTDGSDLYFMVLSRNAQSVLYATFYGQNGVEEHVDGGTSRFSPDGTIYQAVCAGCFGDPFPVTPGVVGPTNGSSRCNLGVIKIDFETSVTADASVDFDEDVDTLCENLLVKFTNNSLNANKYFWNFGNGQTSTSKEPTILFTKGIWDIKLVAIDTVCDIKDSTTFQIIHEQGKEPEAHFSLDYFSCDRNFEVTVFNESLGSNVREWTFGTSGPILGDTVSFQFSTPGPHTIRLIARDTTCFTADTTYQTIQFDPDWPGPNVTVAPDSCKDGRVRVNVTYDTDTVGYIYQWTFHNGVKDTGRVATYRLPATGNYTVHLDLVDTICNAVYSYDFTSPVTRMDQRLWIPNTFTPNGDGRNEVLTIAGNDCFPGDHFVILDSFGSVLFETDEPFNEFWDGTFNGKPVQQDTYVYRFETEDGDVYGYVQVIY